MSDGIAIGGRLIHGLMKQTQLYVIHHSVLTERELSNTAKLSVWYRSLFRSLRMVMDLR